MLRAVPPVPPSYTYLLARDHAFRAHAIQSMTGSSGRQRARTEALALYPVAFPAEVVWREFGSLIAHMFDSIGMGSAEAQILAAKRDALLPKLVSGELPLKDAEWFPREDAE